MPYAVRSLASNARDFCDWWIAAISPLRQVFGSFARQAGRIPETPPFRRSLFEDSIEQGALRIAPSARSAVMMGQCLKLRHATQAVPYSRARTVAGAVALEKTPFSAGEIHVVPTTPGENGEPSFFYVFKRGTIDPDLDAMAAKKTRIDRLGVHDGKEILWLPSRALENMHPVFHHIRYWRRGLLAAALLLSVGFAVTYARAFFVYDAAEQHLAAVIESKRAAAQKVRKLLDQQQKGVAAAAAARKGKNQSLPVVRIWEELTRILPEDAWLTDLAIDGHALTITGFSSLSAASLIATLEDSAFFSGPSFVSPVVRIPGQPGERFEIRLELQAT